MNMLNAWKKIKRSGSYHRNKKNEREEFMRRAIEMRDEIISKRKCFVIRQPIPVPPPIVNFQQQIIVPNNHHNSQPPMENTQVDLDQTECVDIGGCGSSSSGGIINIEGESSDFSPTVIIADDEITRNSNFRDDLRKWAVEHKIKHTALKDLMKILNERFGTKDDSNSLLPDDPRTLLQTPQTISIMPLSNGSEYWHHGLKNSLNKMFPNLDEPMTVSLTINMDGLPLFNSSSHEFWPILFTIAEMPRVEAMVIGILSGKSKTTDLDLYLTPFVDEMHELMTNGVHINGNKITVKLRCFVCDSPARAYVKGVANFNNQHGCLKCTTVGEYSYTSYTNFFPRTECEKRTDEKFRQKKYSEHHKNDSPLLKLNIDMIEQFPVADSLHLLHLGVMKRLLFAWRDGIFRNCDTKWRASTTYAISEYLLECKLPAEFQRKLTALTELPRWKGTQLRTFLHYIGIVVLKDHLMAKAYEHFLLLFCSVTICSSRRHVKLLPLARDMLNQYIEQFKDDIYSEDYITSNIHNLTHLVDDVERFGELESFSAYPFENALGKIKRILRNGNRPLAQVAKRIVEGIGCNKSAEIEWKRIKNKESSSHSQRILLSKRNDGENVPECLKSPAKEEITFYSKVELDDYCISTDTANCWILTNKNQIARVANIMFRSEMDVKLCCVATEQKENFFMIPLASSYFDIYCTDSDVFFDANDSSMQLFDFRDIKFKLVRLKYQQKNVFLPLLHTNQVAYADGE